MVELDRSLPEPKELSDFRSKFPEAPPPDFGSDEFQSAKNATKAQRNAEQGGLCIYCEQTLPATWGHLEHVKPKGGENGQVSLTFVYSNLVHSCDGVLNRVPYKHCGPTKGHSTLTLEPGPGCNVDFLLRTDGTIEPLDTLPEQRRSALRTDIELLLNLNDPKLKVARKDRVESLLEVMRTKPEEFDAFLATSPFRHILERLL